MGKIHGAIYLIIGFFVSFISWVFDFKKLIIFFAVGALMALYGLVHVSIDIFKLYQKHKKKTDPPPHVGMQQSYTQPQSAYRQQWKHCKKCGRPSHLTAKFCHNCGNTTFHLG